MNVLVCRSPFRLVASCAAMLLLALGCASSPEKQPFAAKVVKPAANERLAIQEVLLLVDASGSIDAASFEEVRALVRSFAQGMPDGEYDASLIAFGGTRRYTFPKARFDRGIFLQGVRETEWIGDSTPLDVILYEAADTLQNGTGPVAVVLFSDGVPTLFGRPQGPEKSLEAGRTLTSVREACIHTVQIGSEPQGKQLLNQLAALSPCGSERSLDSVNAPDPLYAFQRDVFLVGDVAAPPPSDPDTDGDGVVDRLDTCAGTPKGAKVDARGCWVLENIEFALNSAELVPDASAELDEVARVMRENPDMRIRVDGHTDASGDAAYNQALSERRAQSVADYLAGAGIQGDRIEVRGAGEAEPAFSGAEAARNRRIELTVL